MKMQMRKFCCLFFAGGVFVSAKFPGGGSGFRTEIAFSEPMQSSFSAEVFETA